MPIKVSMIPEVLDLDLYAGDIGDFQITFVNEINVQVDVSMFIWRAQIRKSRMSEDFVELDIDTSDSANGILIIRIPGAITRDLATDQWDKTAQWDLQTSSLSSLEPLTVLQGTINCSLDVTR